MHPQDAVRHMVKRASPHALHVSVKQLRHPPEHLIRRLIGKRKQQHAVGRDTVLDQPGDAIHERPCFPRTCAGEHQAVAVPMLHGVQLFGIQLVCVRNAQGSARVRRTLQPVLLHTVIHKWYYEVNSIIPYF